MSAYAVIKTGGKQYRVAQDDLIVVEKLTGDAGDAVVFEDVLMMANGDKVDIGAPMLSGVRVSGEIAEQRRADKITIIKHRQRNTYRRTMGHRQHETVVRITSLSGKPAAAKTKPKPAKQAPPETKAAAAPADLRFLDAPDGEADDLKKIGGVGPVIEKKLNGLGIYHFRQIAAFSPQDIANVDEVLNFKGRIERDNWLDQAAAFARGEDPSEE